MLLANLAAAAKSNRKLARMLEKLRRFADERRLRVRPQVFLKVLGGLQLWELCLPDLCVAIEVKVPPCHSHTSSSALGGQFYLGQQEEHIGGAVPLRLLCWAIESQPYMFTASNHR